MAAIAAAVTGFAQTDTTKTGTDTLHVGNFMIIKKNKEQTKTTTTEVHINRKPRKSSSVSTNWWIVDIGFANLRDKTNYGSQDAMNYLQPTSRNPRPTEGDLKLLPGKTSNVNIWAFMQRVSLAKGYVNLKYGLGLEMFNFRYSNNIRYTTTPSIIRDSISFSKNKLYAGYASVPLMLNLNTHPGRKKGLSVSAGVSAGYLIGSRNKQISGERGKEKHRGDLGLEQFRLAYVGEVGIGPVRLFGSYSMTPLHEKGLEQYPYSIGVRLSNW